MRITSVTLKNFRCFAEQQFTFNRKFVVIEGNNGVGKTSLLEALHYVCYLRSFRTSSSSDLIGTNQDHFFVQVKVTPQSSTESSSLQVGYSDSGKLIKYNGKSVSSHKELLNHYRVVSITEDDLELVRGAPEVRRAFLQQSLCLLDAAQSSLITQYKKVLHQRNSILFRAKGSFGTALPAEELFIWSEQLWTLSKKITCIYQSFLQELEVAVNDLLQKYFAADNFVVTFAYQFKNQEFDLPDFKSFWERWLLHMVRDEYAQGRTLFGTHLDDFLISFKTKKAKVFASRGQQKLVVFLMKYAQFYLMGKNTEIKSCLLLDDFLTDFDRVRLEHCLQLLDESEVQVFITCPINFEQLLTITPQMQRIIL